MANVVHMQEENEKICESIFRWEVYDFLKTGGEGLIKSCSFLHRGNICFLKLHNEINSTQTIKIEFNAAAQLHAINLLENTNFKACFLSSDGGEHFIQEMHIRQRERKFSVMFCYSEDACRSIIENKDDFLAEGTLTFCLTWNVVPHRLVPIPAEDDLIPGNCLEKMSKNFGALYKNKTETDLVIRVGDKQFLVHRSIMSARSEVFAAMFRSDTIENRSGTVDIPNYEAAAMEDILHYMYSGEIRGLTPNTAVKMFCLAEKYELVDMRNLCLEFLVQNITMENVGKAAVLADTYNEESSLKNSVIKFIDENYKELENDTAWKQFLKYHPEIAVEYLQHAFISFCDHETERST